MVEAAQQQRRVVVTGGNTGIGYAICKLCIEKHGCYVYMGSRDEAKGKAAIAKMAKELPASQGKIEVLKVDVSSDASVREAAAALKSKLGDQKLYGLVNNAGIMGKSYGELMQTNVYGVKRMTEAFVSMINQETGRIVNLGSGAGPMFVQTQDQSTVTFLSTKPVTWADLEKYMKDNTGKQTGFKAYGLSKAVLHRLTEIHAKEHSSLMVSVCTPGYVQTNMTGGSGNLTPEQGAQSSLHCLFSTLEGSGFYYGSDSLRSPLHTTRDPGTPAFTGYKL